MTNLSPWFHLLWAISLPLVPWETKKGTQRGFSDTLIRLKVLKSLFCIASKNRPFFKGKVLGLWSKLTKFWNRHFSLVYVTRDLGVSQNSLSLSANNALKNNFLFNSHTDFIFFGLFLCLRERFRTRWFDWNLLKKYLSFVQRSTFFQGVGQGFLVKNTKFSSRHFSLAYDPKDLGVS